MKTTNNAFKNKTAEFNANGGTYTLTIWNSAGEYYITKNGEDPHDVYDCDDFRGDIIGSAISRATNKTESATKLQLLMAAAGITSTRDGWERNFVNYITETLAEACADMIRDEPDEEAIEALTEVMELAGVVNEEEEQAEIDRDSTPETDSELIARLEANNTGHHPIISPEELTRLLELAKIGTHSKDLLIYTTTTRPNKAGVYKHEGFSIGSDGFTFRTWGTEGKWDSALKAGLSEKYGEDAGKTKLYKISASH